VVQKTCSAASPTTPTSSPRREEAADASASVTSTAICMACLVLVRRAGRGAVGSDCHLSATSRTTQTRAFARPRGNVEPH
jgi:hypothetical protein